jgi:hypothetical protein
MSWLQTKLLILLLISWLSQVEEERLIGEEEP